MLKGRKEGDLEYVFGLQNASLPSVANDPGLGYNNCSGVDENKP
jgi:hypothetical protein